MTPTEAILLTVITAATPLLLAALGELVAERAGVLNLGVEGMMALGAACGYAAASLADSTLAGVLAGCAAGMALAALFALATIGFGANQVGSGLALTILGLGLSGLVGAPFVGTRRDPVPVLTLPGLSDLPGVGRVLFSQDPFVLGSWALAIAVAVFLARSRAGLRLRAIGENHASAGALGLPVRRARLLAVLFGGACAGLAGVYLALVYTRFWSPGMTAGRGWIALALVVFAAWRVGWLVVGAALFGAATVLQLHAQTFGLGLPSQALSAVPYLATILALVLLSLGRGRAAGAPGSLGTAYLPER
jgi:general nucleoside transport system permease protein